MSKDNKHKVFQTTRVRRSLKNDGCWINKAEQDMDERDISRTDPAVETRPSPVRQNSYVLSTARKFESVISPLSSPLQKTQFFSSKGDSANQVDGEVIPPRKDAQPEGSIVETTDDAKPEAPTDELIQNSDAQPEKTVNTSAENKEEYAPVYRSHSVNNDGAAEVSAEARVEEPIQNGEAQPAKSVDTTSAENKEEHAPVYRSHSVNNDGAAEVSAEALVEEPIQNGEAKPAKSVDTTSAENKEEYAPVYRSHSVNNDGAAEVSAEVRVEEHIENGKEQPVSSANENPDPLSLLWGDLIAPVANTSAENKEEHAPVYRPHSVNNDGAAEVSAEARVEEPIQNGEAQPAKSVDTTPAENKEEHAPGYRSHSVNNDGAAEVSSEVRIEEKIENGEARPVPSAIDNTDPLSLLWGDLIAPVANITAENKGEHADTTVDQSSSEHKEAKVSADSHVEDPVVETSAVAGSEKSKDTADVPTKPAVKPKPLEEPSTKTEPANATHLEDAGVEPAQPAEGSCEKCPPEQAAQEAIAEVAAKLSPDKPDVVDAMPQEAVLQVSVEPVPDLVTEAVSELPTLPAAETATKGSCEKGPAELSAGETIEAAHEAAVESSPETPAVTGAAEEEAAVQVSIEAVPDIVTDTVSRLPTQPAAEIALQSLECEVDPAASAEPGNCDNTVVEQSVASDHVEELNIEDALEPVTVPDAVQDKFSDRPIELSEALDVRPPTAEASPEAPKDPEPSHTEETKANQHSDNTNMSDMSQKSKEEQQSTQTQTRKTKICSFCDGIIEGNIKIHLSDPLITCHPDCLKCGVCATALGDLLTAMFLHNQGVQCSGCFEKVLKI